jgi:hypothetical protein
VARVIVIARLRAPSSHLRNLGRVRPFHEGVTLSEGIFALAGALVGVLGTVLVAAVGVRADDRRTSREALRTACTDFTTQAARIRRLSHAIDMHPEQQAQLRPRLDEALVEARAGYERLRLTAESRTAQEAARYVLHAGWALQATAAVEPKPIGLLDRT